MSKSASTPSIVELAEKSARRRAPSSPRQKQRSREIRQAAIAATLTAGSVLICLWLLLA